MIGCSTIRSHHPPRMASALRPAAFSRTACWLPTSLKKASSVPPQLLITEQAVNRSASVGSRPAGDRKSDERGALLGGASAILELCTSRRETTTPAPSATARAEPQ